MHKKLIIALFALASFTFAQDPSWRDEEFGFDIGYARRGVEQSVPIGQQLQVIKAQDHVTWKLGYTHFFGRENGRGDVGFGIEGGMGFRLNGNDDKRGRYGRAQAKLVFQRNRPDKTFRPFVKLTAGWFRDNFAEFSACNTPQGFCNGVETSETFGGGAGFDIGKGRRRFRTTVEYFTTSFGEQFQHNIETSFGFTL